MYTFTGKENENNGHMVYNSYNDSTLHHSFSNLLFNRHRFVTSFLIGRHYKLCVYIPCNYAVENTIITRRFIL